MKEKNKKRSWKQIVSILSCIVVFCTTYALILPAVTLSTDTFCGKEEHTHSEKCYRSETPLCGLEEGEGSEGHTHTEDCYGNVEVGRNLICGMEEVEGHVHDDSCYQSEFEYGLICGKEESEPTEGHVHNDDCYMSETPICGQEEHKHSRECYSNKEDVEDPKDWEEAYKDINKEEDAKTRILTVAKNEVGYKENEANFSVDENDAEHYYTRYGHLYEDMYGDWNNYFTGYVLKYANVKMNFDKDISKWQNKTIDDQKEEGEEGNVVFFRDDEGELRSGIVTKVDDLTKEIRVIEGDVDGEVKEERINRDKVIAYLSDEVTIEDEDTPLAGGDDQKDDEEPASEKSVDVDGKDQDVEVGDQITLTATSNNIEEDKIVNYQWQYNAAEDCADDAWTDLEGETNKELVLNITEENINYFWRVNVSVDESGNQDGSVPAGAMPKFKLNLVYNEDENPVSDATDENDDSNFDDSEGPIDSKETVATYSSVPFLLGTRAAIPTSTTTTTKDPIFLIQKTWSKEPSDINSVKVSIRYNFKDYEFGADGAPIIEEGFTDQNESLKEVELKWDQDATKKWRVEVPYADIEKLVKDKYPEVMFNPANVYITEEDVPSNYVPSYKSEEKEISDKNTIYTLSSGSTPVTSFQKDKKYIIKSVNSNYAMNANLKAESITYNTMVPDNLIWIATSTGNTSGLQNNDGNYLNIKENELKTSNDSKDIGINQDTLYRKRDNNKCYLIYNNNFTYQKNGSVSSNNQVRAYELTENINEVKTKQFVRTVKNTKVSSGVFGESNGTSNGKEIPHSKSIDYLGDSGGNTDANYTDTDLSDKYRLYLDAGPIADENPIELILVLDKSGSMGYGLDGNKGPGKGNRRWDYLTEALTGWKRSDGYNSWSGADGGILKDFFKANTQNKVKIITFAQKTDVKSQYYQDISGVKDALNITPSGGTNYEDALVKLSSELNKVTRGYTPYVIFISDGEPTYHNDSSGNDEQGGGNYTNTKDAEHTIDAINKLYAAHSINGEPTFSLSTIYFGKDKDKDGNDAPAKVFLSGGTWTYDNKTHTIPRLPTSDGFFVSTNDKTELQESLRLMSLGPRCKSLVISDTLSEDVELDKNTQVVVKAIPIANGSLDYSAATEIYKTATVYDQNGNLITGKLANSVAEFSFDNKDTLSTNNNETKWTNSTVFGDDGGVYINNDGKITLELKFKNNWFMDSNYRYEIGFNVKVPETTYKKYADSGYENVKGSLNSDYLRFGNTTSTNQPGFYSNDSSKLSYTYQNFYDETETLALSTGIQDPNNPGYLQAYQKPVVQAEARLLNLIKYSDDGETPLPDAEFTLYKAVKDGETNYDTVPGTTIKVEKTSVNKSSGSDGQIEFGRLSKNQTYYLKETTPPNGYLYPDYAAIKVVFNGEGTTVALVDSEGNELTEDKYTPGKDSCQVKVEKITSHITLKVNNTPGQELPNTGGAGTKLFTFSGAAVIAASGLMYGYKKKKDKRNGKGGLRK